MAKRVDFAQTTDEIVSRLDVIAEYRNLGVVFTALQPRSSGMIECYARGREESKPSAAINTNTARYIDKGGAGESLSLFDFAVKYGGGRFHDWRDARKHYAEKAGVKLTGGKPPEDPAEAIEFIPWDENCDRLVRNWAKARNPEWIIGHGPAGADGYLDAVKRAGGRVGRYPRWFDKKKEEWRVGEYKVIALPCYGEQLVNADPVAWVLWNVSGGPLSVFRGKGNPPDLVKMKSIGPTRGAMMNFHALARISCPAGGPDASGDPAESPPVAEQPGIEWIIKTGGPSDMLAAMVAMPPELRETHLVVTNASSETGDVLQHQAAIFAGYRAVLIGDCDEAGEVGIAKWLAAIVNVAAEVRTVKLPWSVKKKHGEDWRDFFNGKPIEKMAEVA